jgi:transcriptional regulator with XRE-family HTH domain
MDSRELRRRFGAQVQSLREARGLTQEALAEKIARSVDTVSSIERGINATTLETGYRLAKALEVPLARLFDISDGPSKPLPRRRGSLEQLLRVVADYDDQTVRRVAEVIQLVLKLSVKKRTL